MKLKRLAAATAALVMVLTVPAYANDADAVAVYEEMNQKQKTLKMCIRDRNGELQQEEQPKSLGGMTSIYLPQILRDFPEFNWEELRAEVEQSVKELLETKNVRSAGVVRIHKTVISRYQKYNGTASILCETAAEYWTKAENQENSQTTARNVRQSAKGQHGQNDAAQQTRKKQTVCEAELIYVYNSSLSGTAASLVCPNCGARCV